MKIAICDDERSERQLLCKYVEEWAAGKGLRAEVCCFDSAESFLFAWEDEKDYGILILDIEMGSMNGMELAQKIRERDSDIPILFVTGYVEYRQFGYDVKALHYLMKPMDREKFFTVLDNAMEACMRVPKKEDRFIRIYIDIIKKQLYISVINSMEGPVRRSGAQYLSTKQGMHGFGLLRIDSIVARYHGYINRQSEPGVFATEVTLPLINTIRA